MTLLIAGYLIIGFVIGGMAAHRFYEDEQRRWPSMASQAKNREGDIVMGAALGGVLGLIWPATLAAPPVGRTLLWLIRRAWFADVDAQTDYLVTTARKTSPRRKKKNDDDQ